MQLVLFRHGEAGSATRDADRCLTHRGVAEVRRVACFIESDLQGADLYSSPYVRARQTSTEIQRNAELRASYELPLITPDDDPHKVIAWLQQFDGQSDLSLLLVTHQPLISRLISLLADGDEQGFYPMNTASAAVLKADVWAAGLAQVQRIIHAKDLE